MGKVNGQVKWYIFQYDTHSLHWYLCHGTFSWRGFSTITTNDPHGLSSSSTTQFLFSLSTRFPITSDLWRTFLGGLHQILGWLHVSIWNKNPRIGRRNPSSQNTSQYYVTTYLTLSCKSLGKLCSFILFSNSFVLVCTSNSIAYSLGDWGFLCLI